MNYFHTLEKELGKGRIKINEPLSSHTTFKIGGPADYYFEANTVEELVRVVKLAEELGLPYFILGGGSNILVGDQGFRGMVIKNKSKNIKILGFRGNVKCQSFDKLRIDPERSRTDQMSNRRDRPAYGGKRSLLSYCEIKSALVEADSGVPFNQLVRFTIEEGLGGLEEFIGLPGTVGGAVTGNAHWQNKTVNELVISKKTFNHEILLSVVFRFNRGDKTILWQTAKKAIEYRQKTQPHGSSAGCIFKNIKKSEAARIGMPNLTTSAGFLIEAAGLKGTKIGHVQVSPVHANFIVNLGGAKAVDMLELIDLIKTKVKEKFGVELKEEIVRLGEF